MTDLLQLRFKSPPPLGQIVEMWVPNFGPEERWVVVDISRDPSAEWELQYEDGEDDGDPEISPSTVLVSLRPVR